MEPVFWPMQMALTVLVAHLRVDGVTVEEGEGIMVEVQAGMQAEVGDHPTWPNCPMQWESLEQASLTVMALLC